MKKRLKKKLTKKLLNVWKKEIIYKLPEAGTLISKIYWTKKGVKIEEINPAHIFVQTA